MLGNPVQLMLVAFLLFGSGCMSGMKTETAASPSNTLTPEEAAAGWRLLFDGISLSGWEDPTLETPAGDSWIVESGCIKAVGRPGIREDLFTLDEFGDFELSFEWKISPGGNSGVKYQVQDRAVLIEGKTNPDAQRFEDRVDYELKHRLGNRTDIRPGDVNEEYVVAFEYQLIDNEGHPDAKAAPNRSAGAIYAMAAPVEPVAKRVGEWNRSKIVLRGNRVEHWLNGRMVVETPLDAESILAGLEKRWTRESPVFQLLTERPRKKTPIGLQNHNDEAWFRSIKIRELD